MSGHTVDLSKRVNTSQSEQEDLTMALSKSRRDFLKQSALAGTGFWVAGGLTGAPLRQPGPNERVDVAAIGSGGRGSADINSVASAGGNIVALCDVDDAQAAKMYARFPKAKRYADFRVMLDRQRDIDAVIVATPDNLHCHAAVTAMRLGKHVYCEKPLCHDVAECRLMKETAKRHRVQTQMGNQGTAADGFRRGVEIVQAGALGDVSQVHIWTNRPIWPQNRSRPTETPPKPKSLNWDLWLGPAPYRPYNPVYLPFNWRGWWDFGTGALGDMACHTMNLPYMSLRLGLPTSVIAELTTPLNDETGPEGCMITYEFPVRGKLPPVTLYWYERRRPPAKLLLGETPGASGMLMVGSRGTLYSTGDYGERFRLLPTEQYQGYQDPTPTMPRVRGQHHREWLDAIRTGRPAMSNFIDYAAQLAETVLLGNVAIRCVGQKVVWNAEKMQATEPAAADRFIRREYRKGWSL
jgi:predicted dehydrogenase